MITAKLGLYQLFLVKGTERNFYRMCYRLSEIINRNDFYPQNGNETSDITANWDSWEDDLRDISKKYSSLTFKGVVIYIDDSMKAIEFHNGESHEVVA